VGRNLNYQFLNAINNNFKEGMNKHSLKAEGTKDGVKIFSYSDRKNLIDVASNFSKYMKENHKEVKQIRDISPQHVQGFLNFKSKECSGATLEQYKSKFNKLERLSNATYKGSKVDFTRGLVLPMGKERTRSIEMNREHYSKLLKNIEGSRSKAVPAIQLAGRFGLRVSETVNLKGKDIQLEKGVLHIHESKGGRSRDILITKPEDKAFLQNLRDRVSDNERVIPLKEDSVNKFLQRELSELGITEYKEKGTGIHALRKMYAQDRYNELRGQGYEIKEALDEVSILLGHGRDRDELMQRYVLQIK
jgi:integrase